MGQNGSQDQLVRKVILRLFISFLLLFVIIFLPAGSLVFWQGWLYLSVVFIPFIFAMVYFLNHDREFLERRMRLKENDETQSKIQRLGSVYFLFAFIIPGLDFRLGWSAVPIWAVLLANGVVLSGYILIVRVFKENSFASRIVEVSAEQVVITTGPYARVRHPMYVGVILMYSITPLALGSMWGLIPSLLIIPLIIWRTIAEEKVLVRGLTGYAEYTQKVKWRLLPGIW